VAARAAALAVIPQHIDRLAAGVAAKKIREEMLARLVSRSSVHGSHAIDVHIDVPSIFAAEVQHLAELVTAGDLDSLIAHYPVRETGALRHLATGIGFQNRAEYENAVRQLLTDDEDARLGVRQMFGELINALEAA
jgi:hypothetical protein